jgi:integrase
MFAGLRPSEILRLDWSTIKFDQGVIAVPGRMARKVGTSRLVLIERNLMAWLGPYREPSGALYPGNLFSALGAASRTSTLRVCKLDFPGSVFAFTTTRIVSAREGIKRISGQQESRKVL